MVKKRIEGALFVLGITLVLGAFGGMDCETLTPTVGILFSLLGITSMMIPLAMVGDDI